MELHLFTLSDSETPTSESVVNFPDLAMFWSPQAKIFYFHEWKCHKYALGKSLLQISQTQPPPYKI